MIRWYWVEHRTIAEIADLLGYSQAHVQGEIVVLRRIFRSHGQELPRFNHGRPRLMPNLPVEAVASLTLSALPILWAFSRVLPGVG